MFFGLKRRKLHFISLLDLKYWFELLVCEKKKAKALGKWFWTNFDCFYSSQNYFWGYCQWWKLLLWNYFVNVAKASSSFWDSNHGASSTQIIWITPTKFPQTPNVNLSTSFSNAPKDCNTSDHAILVVFLSISSLYKRSKHKWCVIISSTRFLVLCSVLVFCFEIQTRLISPVNNNTRS